MYMEVFCLGTAWRSMSPVKVSTGILPSICQVRVGIFISSLDLPLLSATIQSANKSHAAPKLWADWAQWNTPKLCSQSICSNVSFCSPSQIFVAETTFCGLFIPLYETWLGNNVSFFVHLRETWLGNNVSFFVHLRETWLGNNVSWFVHLRETWLK